MPPSHSERRPRCATRGQMANARIPNQVKTSDRRCVNRGTERSDRPCDTWKSSRSTCHDRLIARPRGGKEIEATPRPNVSQRSSCPESNQRPLRTCTLVVHAGGYLQCVVFRGVAQHCMMRIACLLKSRWHGDSDCKAATRRMPPITNKLPGGHLFWMKPPTARRLGLLQAGLLLASYLGRTLVFLPNQHRPSRHLKINTMGKRESWYDVSRSPPVLRRFWRECYTFTCCLESRPAFVPGCDRTVRNDTFQDAIAACRR